MAVADPPSGLMDIASTLAQEEIPMKLRCAICNLLATNAFRLPCCDQSICETCQSSLTDTCPVCAHNPVSPDLCKPNKALRITLKAFLRTEEKKREKDRQAAAAPPTPTTAAPVATEAVVPVESTKQDNTNLPVQQGPDEVANEESKGNDGTTNATPAEAPDESVPGVIPPQPANLEVESTKQSEDLPADPTNPPNPSDVPVNTAEENDITEQGDQAWPEPSPYMPGIGQGGFQGMTWNGSGTFGGMNGMAPFMASSMYNFPNPMGMPMDMDPMAANQGMFGDYGMNMTGMGMNMGMNFNGQNMYGTLGWDGSQQNMWQGGQDKFNPNAFANGTGTPYGGAFGGSNMSYHSNADNQSGYYGPSYGRGGFRGRGRGYYNQGRGSYGGSGMNNFGHGPYAGLPNRPTSSSTTDALNGAPINTDPSSQVVETATGQETGDDSAHADTVPNEATSVDGNGQQLQGIPTIDSLDESASARSSFGYGRGGYTQGPMGNRRGGFMGPIQPHVEPRNPGVEGAPAAPRAMREGRPNTSLLRQYGFHNHTRAPSGSNASPVPVSNDPETPQEPQNQIPVNDPSQPAGAKSRSRSRSPSQNRASRPHSPAQDVQDKPESRRDHDTRTRDRHSRSPSHVSSHQSSRLQHRKTDRDRRNGDQSHRSRRHASRDGSRSPISKNRPSERSEKRETNEHTKSVDLLDTRSLAGRISSNNRSNRDRPSQRKEERSRDRIRDKDRDRDRDRDSHRRDKDRDRERDRRDRDRKTDSDRRQDRDRDRDRARERGRDSGRDREKDRKRTRRDRSETADASEYSSHPKSRRVKRNADDDRARERDNAKSSTSEKDPHTLEREARNQERMMREKQRREKASSGSRRDSRPERVVAGRLINFKYEDEL